MELKKGYKQTEVGVIPEDWELRTMGSIGEPLIGLTYSPSNVRDFGTLVLRSSNIQGGRLAFEDNVFVQMDVPDRAITRFNDVLICVRNGSRPLIGKCALIDEKTAGSAFGAFMSVYRSESNRFIFFQFQSRIIKRQINEVLGATINQITSRDMNGFLIPIPATKAEQEAIVEVLSDADAHIESLEKLIAKKRNIKQGTMQQLLTGKKRLPEFSREWETKKLEEIGEITGAGVDKKSNPDEIPVRLVNYLDVFHRDFIYSNELNHWVTAPPAKAQRCAVKQGDIFFTPSSETREDIGISAVAMQNISDAAYSYHVVRLRLFEDWDLVFRTYTFKTRYFLDQAETICEGSGKRYVISLTRFREMNICYPTSKDEQNAISRILFDMDAEIQSLEKKRDKYKMIKQGMMQELLTGRIRLIQEKVVATPMTAATRAPETIDTWPKNGHNWQINEAVVIAALTSVFGSEQYPLGRKRYTKFSYLLHRHVEGKAEGYRKKAAGPYNPDTRYKGPEKIAQNNRYIKPHTNGKFSGFITDDGIEQARGYFDKWYGLEALQWLEQFRYESNAQLELLTTADMAVCELAEIKQSLSVAGVKTVIRSHPEWKAKLNRPVFSDKNIATAIEKSQELFGA